MTKHESKVLPILIFIGIIVAVAVYGFFFLGRSDDMIQGQAEVREVRISGKVPGRIEVLLRDEGDWVKPGDTLAILSLPDVQAKMMQAMAAEQGADAINRKALSGVRSEQIEAGYQTWQQAVAAADIAQKSFERVARLYEKGVVTAQKNDEAQANWQASQAREKAAKAAYDMARNGAEQQDKAASLAQLQRAKGAVSEVEAYISEGYLIAPVEGRITERYVSVGELVGSGAPVMSVSCEGDKWGEFNVREDLLPGFRAGEKLVVYVPALDREMGMRIERVTDAGTYAVWKATKTLGDYDKRTFRIKARFEGDDSEVIAGMSLLLKK